MKVFSGKKRPSFVQAKIKLFSIIIRITCQLNPSVKFEEFFLRESQCSVYYKWLLCQDLLKSENIIRDVQQRTWYDTHLQSILEGKHMT